MDPQFRLDNALSAEEALAKLKNDQYGVVVADYQMPTYWTCRLYHLG